MEDSLEMTRKSEKEARALLTKLVQIGQLLSMQNRPNWAKMIYIQVGT